MPWKRLNPMDQRLLFIGDYLRDLYSFSELCGRYEISRKTGSHGSTHKGHRLDD